MKYLTFTTTVDDDDDDIASSTAATNCLNQKIDHLHINCIHLILFAKSPRLSLSSSLFIPVPRFFI